MMFKIELFMEYCLGFQMRNAQIKGNGIFEATWAWPGSSTPIQTSGGMHERHIKAGNKSDQVSANWNCNLVLPLWGFWRVLFAKKCLMFLAHYILWCLQRLFLFTTLYSWYSLYFWLGIVTSQSATILWC